jgi:hypothetical protein
MAMAKIAEAASEQNIIRFIVEPLGDPLISFTAELEEKRWQATTELKAGLRVDRRRVTCRGSLWSIHRT